jgi:hypothetical protein
VARIMRLDRRQYDTPKSGSSEDRSDKSLPPLATPTPDPLTGGGTSGSGSSCGFWHRGASAPLAFRRVAGAPPPLYAPAHGLAVCAVTMATAAYHGRGDAGPAARPPGAAPLLLLLLLPSPHLQERERPVRHQPMPPRHGPRHGASPSYYAEAEKYTGNPNSAPGRAAHSYQR